jgi:predicted nucleic acid-binding protein
VNSVLLDTSFLISFSDPARPQHEAAMAYYKECVRRQVPMYLSTIVISEFQVKQAINDLPLRNFVVLPFNIDHAMRCDSPSLFCY